MKLAKAPQPARAKGAPAIVQPVFATLAVPVYYTGSSTLQATERILCASAFAELVLRPMEDWAQKYSFAVCHLGVYACRRARKADGSPIVPVRWSNHSTGCAIDLSGIRTADGERLDIAQMKAGCPAKLHELQLACAHTITAAGRRAEIVDEGGWLHIGIWR